MDFKLQPEVIIFAVVVLLHFGYKLYKKFFAPPPSDDENFNPFNPSASATRTDEEDLYEDDDEYFEENDDVLEEEGAEVYLRRKRVEAVERFEASKPDETKRDEHLSPASSASALESLTKKNPSEKPRRSKKFSTSLKRYVVYREILGSCAALKKNDGEW